MKTHRLVFAAFLMLGGYSVQAQLTWQSNNGPWFARIEDLAAGFSGNQVVLYAADSADVAELESVAGGTAEVVGVWRTRDGGLTWAREITGTLSLALVKVGY